MCFIVRKLFFVNKVDQEEKEAEWIVAIWACPDTLLYKSSVDCYRSSSAAASGTVLKPVNMLPDAASSVMMKRSYFNSCLGELIYSLTLNRPPPLAVEYCALQMKNWRLICILLTYSLTSIIFLLLSDKIQDCRKAMRDKDYKWGCVPRFKGG